MENWKIRKLEIAKLRNGRSEYWNDVIRKERILRGLASRKIMKLEIAKLQSYKNRGLTEL